MHLRKFALTVAVLVIIAPFSAASQVYAANFSSGEIMQVHHFQHEYADLNKTTYNIHNIYTIKPHLSRKFRAGVLKASYTNSQLAYINYYRSLFGLNPVITTKTANLNAQKTAAVMAAIDANPFINQHGLPSEKRPRFISRSLWKLAQDTSETSNLNFNINNQSAGDVITDLITDHYNLSGSDTGHRAWLLSTHLTKTGIGAAYGRNGYRYSVQQVLNINDLFKDPSQAIVAYPSAGLFPLELSKGKNIAWSLYLSNKVFTGKPQITITDLDTNTSYDAVNVKNYSSAGYGDFKTVITYSPGKTPLISGHKYEVNIVGLYKYRFKLFPQEPAEQEAVKTENQTYQHAASQKNLQPKSAFSLQSAKLWAVLNPKSKNQQNFNYFDALKKGQWNRNFFIRNFQK